MSAPDGDDDVDGGHFGKPQLSSSSSVPNEADLSTPSPDVAGRSLWHTFSHDPELAGMSGLAEAKSSDDKDGVAHDLGACQRDSQTGDALFDWANVDLVEFARLKGFLRKQAWAQEYYDEDNGFHVALADFSKKEELQRLVNEECFSIPVIFVPPSGSKYEQCSDIGPGDRLEDTDGSQLGIYSGSIGSCPSRIYGLTAAHTIKDDLYEGNEEIRLLNQNVLVARSDHVFKEVKRNEDERITADVRLLRLEAGVHSKNEIHVVEDLGIIPNGIYVPTVYQRGAHMLRRKEIVLRNRARRLIVGIITNWNYTNEMENLFNTITIVNSHEGSVSVTKPGDCGALVWLVPPIDSNSAEVVGIVIGRLRSNLSKGVINNLEDVLRFCPLFGTNPQCANFYDSNC